MPLEIVLLLWFTCFNCLYGNEVRVLVVAKLVIFFFDELDTLNALYKLVPARFSFNDESSGLMIWYLLGYS